MSMTRDNLWTGSGNRYSTRAAAEARQRTLMENAGICTGYRSNGDGTFSLLYDPWAGEAPVPDDEDEG